MKAREVRGGRARWQREFYQILLRNKWIYVCVRVWVILINVPELLFFYCIKRSFKALKFQVLDFWILRLGWRFLLFPIVILDFYEFEQKQRFLNLGISMYNLPFYLFTDQNRIFLKFKSQIALSDTSYRQRDLKV